MAFVFAMGIVLPTSAWLGTLVLLGKLLVPVIVLVRALMVAWLLGKLMVPVMVPVMVLVWAFVVFPVVVFVMVFVEALMVAW